MKVLMVDDQRAILESMNRGIHWENLGIDEVLMAGSAAEAKLILVNFPVDIVLCDIEMPGEDGLSLLEWLNARKKEVCFIFLTSHADFAYARRAIELGGFDYVLQPVKYAEVEEVLLRAAKHVARSRSIERMQKTQKNLVKQRDIFLTAMVTKIRQRDYGAAEKSFDQLAELLGLKKEELTAYAAVSFTRKKRRGPDTWDSELKLFLCRNILEELLGGQIRVCVSCDRDSVYHILVLTQRGQLDDEGWRRALERFCHFLDASMENPVCVYTGDGISDFSDGLPGELLSAFGMDYGTDDPQLSGVQWRQAAGEPPGDEENDARMQKVLDYIHVHIHQNISRAEAAAQIYVSEEYFSRIFKAHTGLSFKEYVLKEKMRTAMHLLANTGLSVGLVASKVGFDNFSHFSKTFKKYTDRTPQEYRKEHGR